MIVFSYLQSISVILASVIAACTVVYGINAWRREHIGKRKLELMEEILALFYESRDAIRFIRSPFGYVGEGSTRNSDPNETPEEKRVNDQAYVAIERYKKHHDLFNKIRSMKYRYMAQLGKDSCKPFDELDSILNEIFTASEMLAYLWLESERRVPKTKEQQKQQLDELKEYREVFWQMTPEKDPITPRLESLISEIESQSAKIIGRTK